MVEGVVEDAADASPSFPFPALALISQLPALLADNLWDTFFSRDNCLAISMLFCLLQTLAYWHTGRISALELPHGIRLKLHSCLDHVPACYISPAPSPTPPAYSPSSIHPFNWNFYVSHCFWEPCQSQGGKDVLQVWLSLGSILHEDWLWPF